MITTDYIIELKLKNCTEEWEGYWTTFEGTWKRDLAAVRKKYPKQSFRVIKKQTISEELVEVLS